MGSKVDPKCVNEAVLQLILLYARQMLRKESNIDGRKETYSSAELHVKTVETIKVLEHLEVLEVPEGFPPIQEHSAYIPYYVNT